MLSIQETSLNLARQNVKGMSLAFFVNRCGRRGYLRSEFHLAETPLHVFCASNRSTCAAEYLVEEESEFELVYVKRSVARVSRHGTDGAIHLEVDVKSFGDAYQGRKPG